MDHHKNARQHDQAALRLLSKCRNDAFELRRFPDRHRNRFHTNRRGCGPEGLEHTLCVRSSRGIEQEHHSDGSRRYLHEQLEPLACDCMRHVVEPRGVAAGTRKASDETAAYGIGDLHEHHRRGTTLAQNCRGHGGRVTEDHVRPQIHELPHDLADRVRIRSGPPMLETNVATHNPSELPKPLVQCRDTGRAFRIILRVRRQYADPGPPFAVGTSRNRARQSRAAEPADELPSFQCDHELVSFRHYAVDDEPTAPTRAVPAVQPASSPRADLGTRNEVSFRARGVKFWRLVFRAMRYGPFPGMFDWRTRRQRGAQLLYGGQTFHSLPPPAKRRILWIQNFCLRRETKGIRGGQ